MVNAKRASSAAPVNRESLESVQGQINFARRTSDEKAPAVVTPPQLSLPLVNYDVTIRNARPITNELSLDVEGFTLVKHNLPCIGERDVEILRNKYQEEMVPFIKDYFKASWVTPTHLGGLTIRSLGGTSFSPSVVEGDRHQDRGNDVRTFGAGFAHIDYSPVAGPMIAARDNQLRGLEIRAYSRLMIIQTWQALSPPPQDFPLAFCDSSSISDADLVDTYFRGYGVTHMARILHYNSSHRWYYFPEMVPSEFILFKGYDSAMHDRRWSAHSAFDNRRAHPHAKPRESIETRYYVYYE